MSEPLLIKLSNPLRVLLGLLCAAAGGLAFVLAFPPFEIWPLIFIGWVLVLFAQFRLMPRKLGSLASALGLFVWLQGYLGRVFAPVGSYMAYLPLILSVFTLFAEMSLLRFHEKTGYRWFVASGVANWAGTELIRLFVPIAGTWAFIATPLFRQVWLIQPVSVFGIIGLGALIYWVNLALTLMLMGLFDQRWKLDDAVVAISDRQWKRWMLSAGVTLAAWIILSLVLLRPMDTPRVTVAAVQPAVSPIINANQGHADLVEALHARMLEQTRQAADQGARLIMRACSAFLWDPQVEDKLGLAGLAQETNSYLAVGYVVNIQEGLFRNEATVIDPQGRFLGVFGKDHPVVFGGETSPTRGTYPVYDTEIGKLGTIICYDLDYTDTARKLVRQGAQLIAVPSNDWTTIAGIHYTHLVFRAVENRVAMVKADGGFDSAIIDPYGRIVSLASCTEGCEATVVGEVQLGSGAGTLNTRLGDWVGWLALAGMFFFIFSSGWLAKKA